jgi:AcrR family transcriptional regulator
MSSDGHYAKGRAKREELLKAALEVFASDAAGTASLADIARAAGVSRATLLYYFESREALFTEVAQWRDDVNRQLLSLDDGLIDGFLRLSAYNQTVPGVIRLFTTIAADATDREHPSHDRFRDRYAELVGTLTAQFAERQREGLVSSRVPAESLARMYVALSDGLQVQWLYDRDVRTVDLLGQFLAILDAPDARPAAPEAPTSSSTADEL